MWSGHLNVASLKVLEQLSYYTPARKTTIMKGHYVHQQHTLSKTN